jgi:hypothetical protein
MEELSVKIRQNVRELLGVKELESASVGELES